MAKKRDLALDYVRGVAITMIVMYHFYGFLERADSSVVYWAFHTMQIPVFMFVSGMLAHSSIDRYGFRQLIQNRTIRLLVPFLSFYVIWGLIDYHNFISIPLAVFKQGYWFMLVLFELMLLLSFIKQVSSKYQLHSYIVNAVVYAVITLYVFLTKGSTVNEVLSISLMWHYYPFFMMGYYSYRLMPFLQLKYAPAYLLLYVGVQYYFFTTMNTSVVPLCNFFSLMFLMSVILNGVRPLERLFAQVGQYTLQIYLVHFFLLKLILPYLPIVDNRFLEFFYILAVSATVMFVSVAISKVLMKNETMAMLLFGIKKKNAAPRG